MKVSVSLPDDDVAFVDRYALEHGTTRSAAMHQAVQLLRHRDLTVDYAAAADEWQAGDDAALWDAVTGDGVR